MLMLAIPVSCHFDPIAIVSVSFGWLCCFLSIVSVIPAPFFCHFGDALLPLRLLSVRHSGVFISSSRAETRDPRGDKEVRGGLTGQGGGHRLPAGYGDSDTATIQT